MDDDNKEPAVKRVTLEQLDAINRKVRQRNAADRALRRAALELEDVVDAALEAAGAAPGASVSLETGVVSPPAPVSR